MEDHNIKLPEPIHSQKIKENLDLFSKDSLIRRWVGYDVIDTLFYLYLFNKYKHNCLIKYKGIVSHTSLGVELNIKLRMSKENKIIYNTHLNETAKQLANCIKRQPKNIIIPLYLKTVKGGHANILIYRKDGNVIEHYEPHGSYLISGVPKINDIIIARLDEFINLLNRNLIKDKIHPVKLINSDIVCPRKFGLQILEGMSTTKKLKLEGGGYCAAWSMFFTELALKNPDIPSNELLNGVFQKLELQEENNQSDYLRKVIIGYINLIYEKIAKYFSFITGTNVNVNDLNEFIKKINKYQDYYSKYNSIIDIEIQLLNDPTLSQEQYINNLKIQESQSKNEEERAKIKSNIELIERMNNLFNPSPISTQTSKTNKSSQEEISIKDKNSRISSNKSISESTIKLESLSSVSSFDITPNCPEGKFYDSKKGRCVKLKNSQKKTKENPTSPKLIKKTSQKSKTRKLKPCLEGEERNPETGRCKKIKVYTPCPPGQERDSFTKRCKTLKLKKK
jgi:hypothetical protein